MSDRDTLSVSSKDETDSEPDMETATMAHINSKEIRARLESKLAELQSFRSRPGKKASVKSDSSKSKSKSNSSSSSSSSSLFLQWLAMDTAEPVMVSNVHDDLARETTFYETALASAKQAKAMIEAETGSFFPPPGYVPLMLKDKEHMNKVERKIQAETAALATKEELRRQRSLRKFGKQVQMDTLKARQETKSKTMASLKSKSKSHSLNASDEFESSKYAGDGEFDIQIDSDDNRRDARSSSKNVRKGKGGISRKQRDEKYGFGGKKSKANTKKSFNEDVEFNPRKNKEPFRGVHFKRSKSGSKPSSSSSNRPGKARRQQSRNRQASRANSK